MTTSDRDRELFDEAEGEAALIEEQEGLVADDPEQAQPNDGGVRPHTPPVAVPHDGGDASPHTPPVAMPHDGSPSAIQSTTHRGSDDDQPSPDFND